MSRSLRSFLFIAQSSASRDDVLLDDAKRYRVDTEKLQKAVAKEFAQNETRKQSR
jgi:hypothetical protein